MAASLPAVDLLGSGLHVWPDFHGNRSPLADPTLKGMVREGEWAAFPPAVAFQIQGFPLPSLRSVCVGFRFQVSGLSLSQSLDDLALLYLATVQALAVSHRSSPDSA